ncbi:hypothetical protein B0H13DRAFT_2028196, partial [Mycena leptocephala]
VGFCGTYILSFPSHPLLRSRPIYRSTSATATISVMHMRGFSEVRCHPPETRARQRIWDKLVRVKDLAAGRVTVPAREVAPRLPAENVHEAGPRPTWAHDVLLFLESYTKLQRVARCRAMQRICLLPIHPPPLLTLLLRTACSRASFLHSTFT